MLAIHRREKIMDLLREDGAGKVLDLARLFKVTEVTIRQDLEKLEKEGLIEKKIIGTKPPLKTGYKMSSYGKTICPIIKQMWFSGEKHNER